MFIFVHLVFLLLQSPQMITFWSAKVCVCVDSKFVCVLHMAPLQLGNPSAGSVSSRERLFGFRQVQNCHLHMYQQSQRRESYPARALRALGLLLADGAPTVGWGKTFWSVSRVLLTKTGVREGFKNPRHGNFPLGGYPPPGASTDDNFPKS